jgi:hypothetical protein
VEMSFATTSPRPKDTDARLRQVETSAAAGCLIQAAS